MDECLLDASYLEHVFSLRVRGMYRDYLTLFFLKKKKIKSFSLFFSPLLGPTL